MAKPDPERDARLAAALRDNLKRRKAQARDLALPSPRQDGADGDAGAALPPSH